MSSFQQLREVTDDQRCVRAPVTVKVQGLLSSPENPRLLIRMASEHLFFVACLISVDVCRIVRGAHLIRKKFCFKLSYAPRHYGSTLLKAWVPTGSSPGSSRLQYEVSRLRLLAATSIKYEVKNCHPRISRGRI